MAIPLASLSAVCFWTGTAADGKWSTPLNWDGGTVPGAADDVLLDNSRLDGSYQLNLPDQAVTLHSLTISPASGNRIEVVLPSTNIVANALTITGSGLLLDSGAVFRNASGLSGGESLSIADSIRIRNGAAYIHATRAAHAAGIVDILSIAPGTEYGIFQFDVPRASYTISVSNRTYGSLVLSAATFGSTVNYTGSGSNPLHVRGDLRIGMNVNLSLNLSGSRGNVEVDGDFIQQGGTLNLGSGAANTTSLQVGGDCTQLPGALITTTSLAGTSVGLNGKNIQWLSFAGALSNGIVFSQQNAQGSRLLQPLRLPLRFELQQGVMYTSEDAPLILLAGCSLQADSTGTGNAYVDGPMRREGLNNEPYALFPVGKAGSLRWLELKEASGNFTVEYQNEDPAVLGGAAGPGIDHISKTEYWTIKADGEAAANIELSFASPQSGGVTDPDFLQVASLESGVWIDNGHSHTTGGLVNGSVTSERVENFNGQAYTLASSEPQENPLPLTILDFRVLNNRGYPLFEWSVGMPETADHFELLESTDRELKTLALLPADPGEADYKWMMAVPAPAGWHYYRLRATDKSGVVSLSRMVSLLIPGDSGMSIRWVPGWLNSGNGCLLVKAAADEKLEYRIVNMSGRVLRSGTVEIIRGESRLALEISAPGIYQYEARDTHGNVYRIRFIK
ncbi:MAG TPA: hypothetical protein VG890_04620 [Puia sp.]|nr:hypothetical protein [Puia sp.]